MNFQSLKVRLSLPLAAMAVTALLITGYVSISFAKDMALKALEESITSTINFHKLRIESYFNNAESSLSSLASGFVAVQAMHEFEEAVYLVDSSISAAFIKLRDAARDENESQSRVLYDQAMSRYDPFFKSIVKNLQLTDLFLIDTNKGYVVYSVLQGAEHGKSVLKGNRKKTGLGGLVGRLFIDPKIPDNVDVFKPYPGPNDPGSLFIASPIMDAEEMTGIVAFRLSAGIVENMLAQRLAEGYDFSVSLLDKDGSAVAAWGQELGGRRAALFAGGQISKSAGLDGGSILSLSSSIDIAGSEYFLVVEADEGRALGPLGNLKLSLILAIIPLCVVAFISLFFWKRTIIDPVTKLGEAMKIVITEGGPAPKPLVESSNDEIGSLASLFNDMNRRIESVDIDRQSKDKSYDRYAESLTEKTSRLQNDLNRRGLTLEKNETEIKELGALVNRQKKELERQQRKLDTNRNFLKRMDEARERFLMVAELELKERLHSIMNSAMKITSKSEEESAGTLMHEIKILERLIDKAITGFSMESGHGQLSLTKFDIALLGREIVRRAGDLAEKRKLKLVFESEAAAPLILGDKDQIRMVMEGMVENGLKYTPENGGIHVRIVDSDSMVRFEVRDTGAGMDKDQIQRVFEKFYKIKGDSPESNEGMGLGLYVSRMIIQRHDGKIGAESEPGAGSLFYFELKREPSPAQKLIPGLDV